MKKVITVCIGGIVRSAGIADVLKNNHGKDAIALSAINNTDETFEMLCDWADRIIIVEPRYDHKVPEQYRVKWENCKAWDEKYNSKRRVVNIGPDIWGNARNPDLINVINSRINEIL